MKIRTTHYKRSNGRWVFEVVYDDPDTGEEKRKSFTCTSSRGRESKQKGIKFAEKLEEGDYSDIRKVTLEGWLRKYLTVYCTHLEQTTMDGYKNYIYNHIIPAIGKKKIGELKPLHIQQYYNQEREKGFKYTTIRQQHAILRRAFKKAIGDGLMAKNPCDAVDAPSPEDYEPTIYSEEQYSALLNLLIGHPMEAVILLAGMCGLRRGELLGLTWEDIDLTSGILSVRRNIVSSSIGAITKAPKTKTSARTISIPSDIIPALKRLRGIGKLLTKANGKDYNPGSVSRIFKEFLKTNKLPHIRLHDLRHFNGTMMLKYGVTEREASSRLGHSNLMMTKKYQHVLEEMDKTSAEKLNKVIDLAN